MARAMAGPRRATERSSGSTRPPPRPARRPLLGRCRSGRASSCSGMPGWPVTPAVAVRDADAAVEAARPLGGHAVASRSTPPTLAHKSDLGLVRLGRPRRRRGPGCSGGLLALARSGGLDAAWPPRPADGRIRRRADRRATARRVVRAAVMVGLGGVLAEVLDDVAIRLAPVTQPIGARDARRAARRPAPRRRPGRPGGRPRAVADLIVGARPASASRGRTSSRWISIR